ncbi:MAG TPA: hypothetical protein VFB14_07825 [Bryobacteraceae bacterium]|jgi:hypothetical protein|nr:hypothetical protein [Bryobacteraceae bacterium]
MHVTEDTVALLLVFIFTCAYFGLTISKALHELPWTDEVSTLWGIRYLPVTRLWSALARGIDGSPPTYYYLQAAIAHFWGSGLLAMRFASIVAFYVLMLSVFRVLRNAAGGALAAFAMIIPLLTGARACATWVRPHAILAACFGVALVIWTRGYAKWRGRRTAAFAIVLTIAIAFHLYGLVLVASFAAMEAIWSLRYSEIRWGVWLALTIAALSLLFWLPFYIQVKQWGLANAAGVAFFMRPTITALVGGTASILFSPHLCILYGLIAFYSVVPSLTNQKLHRGLEHSSAESAASHAWPAYLDIAMMGAMLLPVIAFLFALLVTKRFSPRYYYAVAVAPALFLPAILSRLRFAKSFCILAVLAVSLLAAQQAFAKRSDSIESMISSLERLNKAPSILVPNGSDFINLSESVPSQMRARLVYPLMPPAFQMSDIEPRFLVQAWGHWRPDLNIVPIERFLARREPFYVVVNPMDPRENITDWLIHHGELHIVEQSPELIILEANGASFSNYLSSRLPDSKSASQH